MNFPKILLILLCTLALSPSFAQDYERIDATIQLYPTRVNSPEELSFFIARDFTTDEEKVRAIYSWLILNIVYEPSEYDQFDYSFKNYRERNSKDEKLREKIIARTLKKGIAVCEGYAMTFEKLCQLLEINNYLVRGDTKSSFNDIGRAFKLNHMWNVIYIGESPYLFDATWGAGKHDGVKFTKDPTYFFYKTAPAQFIKSHYPDMPEDSFLSELLTQEEYLDRPIIIDKSLFMEDIISPKKGVISSDTYKKTIPFEIRIASPKKITYSYGKKEKKVLYTEGDGVIKFNITKASGNKNLLVYFDGKPVLAYKVR